MMCEACERGDHANCCMQTWCECDCVPEGYLMYWPGDDPELMPSLPEDYLEFD